MINSLLIPYSLYISFNSPPLSNHRVLIFLSVWFSTKDLYSLNLLKTSLFHFKKYIQVLCEKSSIKETLYTYSLNELYDTSPHTFKCTIYSIPLAFISPLGNVFFTFFPCAHPLQIPSCFAYISGNPETSLFSINSTL